MSTPMELIKLKQTLGNSKKSVGLITGNFDVLHIGHIKIFAFAKSKVDLLVVGVDATKIANSYRPYNWKLINSTKDRIMVLKQIKLIDFVFPITTTNTNEDIDKLHMDVLMTLKPSAVFTNPVLDLYIEQRRQRCQIANIPLIDFYDLNILKSESAIRSRGTTRQKH